MRRVTRRAAAARRKSEPDAALQPLRARAAEARQLADLATGQGANALHMTLSAFVLAARLEAAGTPVSIVARGAHLAAVQRDGLILVSGGERIVTRPNAVPHGDAIGPQDYLILTLKAHSVEPALPQLAPLVGPHTTIVSAINGIPWW